MTGTPPYDIEELKTRMAETGWKIRFQPGDKITAEWYAPWTQEKGHERMVTEGIVVYYVNEHTILTDMGTHGLVIIPEHRILVEVNKCYACNTGDVVRTMDTRALRVGTQVVKESTPSWTCVSCQEVVYNIIDLMAAELNVARQLIEGPLFPEVFAFSRKVMGWNRKRVADVFEVSEDQIKRWESGEDPIPEDAKSVLKGFLQRHQVT